MANKKEEVLIADVEYTQEELDFLFAESEGEENGEKE